MDIKISNYRASTLVEGGVDATVRVSDDDGSIIATGEITLMRDNVSWTSWGPDRSAWCGPGLDAVADEDLVDILGEVDDKKCDKAVAGVAPVAPFTVRPLGCNAWIEDVLEIEDARAEAKIARDRGLQNVVIVDAAGRVVA